MMPVRTNLNCPDRALSSLLELLHNRNYTVIYTTTPEELPDGSHMTSKQYEMSDYDQPLHTDLKRDLLHPPPEPLEVVGNQTMIDGPLFAKYQFFTPGKRKARPFIQRIRTGP